MKKLMGPAILFGVAALGSPKTESKPDAGGSHIHGHTPAPAKVTKPALAAPPSRAATPARVQEAAPPGDNRIAAGDKSGRPQVPHVDAKTDKWVGRDIGFNDDPHYKLAQQWEHKHLSGGFGRPHVFTLAEGGPERFWFGKFYWPVVSDDYNLVADWSWASGLANNFRLGTYAQVEHLG